MPSTCRELLLLGKAPNDFALAKSSELHFDVKWPAGGIALRYLFGLVYERGTGEENGQHGNHALQKTGKHGERC